MLAKQWWRTNGGINITYVLQSGGLTWQFRKIKDESNSRVKNQGLKWAITQNLTYSSRVVYRVKYININIINYHAFFGVL